MDASFFPRENPLYATYAFYAGVLVFKVIAMAPLTARFRFGKGIFMNPEDTAVRPKSKVAFGDPDIERVRRAHRNDLENIPVFLFISLLYVLTSPDPGFALSLFRGFAVSRILHTIVYAIKPLPQPSRFFAFVTGQLITTYMAWKVVTYFY